MNKEVKKILVVLGLFAIADGFFYNFQELWMASNNLSIKTIGIVFSLCSLLTVSTIFLCSNLISQEKIKSFASVLLLIKAIITFILFYLNGLNAHFMIKFLTMIDYVVDVEIYACIYPMITYITKDNKLYALRGLIYTLLYSIGIVISNLLLNKALGFINFNYNLYVLISSALYLLAFVILTKVSLNLQKSKDNVNILMKLLEILKKDKISKAYLLFLLFGQISYSCVLGLLLSLLTVQFGFIPQTASNMELITSILGSIFGFIVLAKLTFKNDYITISVKYLCRTILYFIAFIFNIKALYLLAMVYPLFISSSYSHITDAPYVNRFSKEYQLSFCNLCEMVKYFGGSIGLLICMMGINNSLRFSFLFAFIFALLQATFSYYALYLRKKDVNDR